MNINISYIIATRNRFEYLKITLEKLVAGLLSDEEIVVVDGNSTDGAKEYLQELFVAGKIHQYVSEPDRNQAHGWNKAMLMAKGVLIKKIIDDDVHSYSAVRKCADFMLNNPQVDICISNCLTVNLLSPNNVEIASRLKYFLAWKSGETTCFTFSDVYMLVRKSSLSFLGLFDTQFTMMDWEYALRCSYLKATIIYYTGYNAISVSTPGNVTSSTGAEKLKQEGLIGRAKYGYKGDRSDISLYSELKIAIGKAINYQATANKATEDKSATAFESKEDTYNYLYQIIEDYNQKQDFDFIV